MICNDKQSISVTSCNARDPLSMTKCNRDDRRRNFFSKCYGASQAGNSTQATTSVSLRANGGKISCSSVKGHHYPIPDAIAGAASSPVTKRKLRERKSRSSNKRHCSPAPSNLGRGFSSSSFWNWGHRWWLWISIMAANVLIPILFPLSDELDYSNVTKFLRIGLADKNDHPPFFEQSLYEVEIEEDEAVNQTLLTLSARDLDEASRMYYEIVDGNEDKTFSIGKLSGEISLARPLDYEKKKKYDLRLLVSDGRHESDATIIVHVLDVNDNPPLFDRHLYETRITEEDDEDLPKHILTVTVTDGDVDRPQDVIFSLSGQGIDVEHPEKSHFHIVPSTGEVYVKKALDRDQPGGRPSWGLTVFAQDEGGTGLVGYSEIVVKLKDINDNPPVFLQSIYYGNVTENGTYGLEAIAMRADDYDDPDEGNNAQLTYSIEKNVIDESTAKPIFMIEPETGVVRTALCCLDREETQDYLIQVVAVDGGGLKGTGTASILVLDINDRPPRFNKDEWVIDTEETDGSSLPTEPILTVSVHDEDEDNIFNYRVVDSSGFGADKFDMVTNEDGTGSLMVVKPLDYEDPRQARGFRFQIEVSDNGEADFRDTFHRAKSWVRVRLKDINDNEPEFIEPDSEVQVFENTPLGRSLLNIIATDPDKGGTSKISYSIERSSDRHRHFSIDDSGSVSVQRSLDRETNPYHLLRILAIDDGVPPKTSTNLLTVIVMDINDNAPKILDDYRPVLPENQQPMKFAEIIATDADDPLRNNGPPFHFSLSSHTSETIRSSFKVENVPGGANGEGMAIISSLRKFDREVQKEYHVPIVIKDSGVPPMTGTSTLTVVIGDDNDNSMKTGKKDVMFYSYKGRAHETQVGRVYVWDPDDWDTEDKKFMWASLPHPNFHLDENTGMLTMKYATSENSYHLHFHAHDSRHLQSKIEAKVIVNVKHVSETAVRNAGSVRIKGISGESFISEWDYKTRKPIQSIADTFKKKLASVFNVNTFSIDLFSIQTQKTKPPLTDIFFSVYNSGFFRSIELNGLIMLHKEEIENELDLNIVMVGIDECLQENLHCDGSCTNKLEVFKPQHLIDANRTSFVGVQTKVIPECLCGARNFSERESCRPNPCLNNGMCVEEGGDSVRCNCPEGYEGPRCQALTRTFQGDGFVWLPPLQTCAESHLIVEFITVEPDGLVFYNGPLTSPKVYEKHLLVDFIALELDSGKLRFLLNFGSGTLQLQIDSEPLNDGRWHRVDVFWDKETARIDLDQCIDAEISEIEGTTERNVDLSSCQARGLLPPFSEYLNVNSPLQVGGLFSPVFADSSYSQDPVPFGKPFQGCIRNLMMNSQIYDLANPGLQRSSETGCILFERTCNSNSTIVGCGSNGFCDGILTDPQCVCYSGWTGTFCDEPTVPAFFETQSYIKFALSFKPNPFHTSVQLRFRTWERNGELFRISDQLSREYAILEIRNRNLQFRYNLNHLRLDERVLCLSKVIVNNGEWHFVIVERYGSNVILSLDGGEGKRYNETESYTGNVLMDVDKQEGVYAGGKVEYSNVNIFTVHSDYKLGCMDDLRVEGKSLPLPPSLTGTQWAQATVFHNLASQCISPNQCLNITCIAPLICKDLWMRHECGCPEGTVLSKDHRLCLDEDECLSGPCQNGGICHNQQPSYVCQCPDGFSGNNCEMIQEMNLIQPSLPALAAIIICIVIVLALASVFLFFLCRRRRRRTSKEEAKKGKQETAVKYDDKGGGEGEVTILDLTALNVPSVSVVTNGGNFIPRAADDEPVPSGMTNVDVVVCRHERKNPVATADLPTKAPLPPPPNWDDLRNYAYEGSGSTSNSLSSLGSGTDSSELNFDRLNSWGAPFTHLSTLYKDCDSEGEESKRRSRKGPS